MEKSKEYTYRAIEGGIEAKRENEKVRREKTFECPLSMSNGRSDREIREGNHFGP